MPRQAPLPGRMLLKLGTVPEKAGAERENKADATSHEEKKLKNAVELMLKKDEINAALKSREKALEQFSRAFRVLRSTWRVSERKKVRLVWHPVIRQRTRPSLLPKKKRASWGSASYELTICIRCSKKTYRKLSLRLSCNSVEA